MYYSNKAVKWFLVILKTSNPFIQSNAYKSTEESEFALSMTKFNFIYLSCKSTHFFPPSTKTLNWTCLLGFNVLLSQNVRLV